MTARRGELGLQGYNSRFGPTPRRDGCTVLDAFDAETVVGRMSDTQMRHLAADPNASWRELLTLSGNPDVWIRTGLAANPASTADVLDLVADSDSETVRAAVARHPNTHYETLSTLLYDTRDTVRAAAAAHPELTADDQLRAAADPSEQVQAGLLRNPRLTVMATQGLRQSQHTLIREQMAARGNPIPA